MVNLLESLLGGAVKADARPRLSITRRPFPKRPRELLEVFAAMGRTASMEGLLRGIDLTEADPLAAHFAALGRWPTSEERAAHADPYKPAMHFRRLLLGQEFRRRIAARALAAFPEKRRVLFIRLPRCAGQHVLETLRTHHPLLTLGLDDPDYRDASVLMPLIGACCGKFDSTTTLAVALPGMAQFISPGGAAAEGAAAAQLHWGSAEPPCRTGDLMFAILRPPRDLALSEANAALATLRADASATTRGPARQTRTGPLPGHDDIAGWRTLGRTMLREIISRNPVCHALGDGTAAGAFAACARVPVQLIGLPRYFEWARVALGPMEAPKQIGATPILRPEDLAPADRDALEETTAEDRLFYDRFEAKSAAAVLPAVAGHLL